jgi:hypothetical protein
MDKSESASLNQISADLSVFGSSQALALNKPKSDNSLFPFFSKSQNNRTSQLFSCQIMSCLFKEFQTVPHQSVNSYRVLQGLQGQDVILKQVAIRQKSCYFQIISQHTQRGLSRFARKCPFCGWSGASPPTPENGTTEKSKIFQLCRYRVTPKED